MKFSTTINRRSMIAGTGAAVCAVPFAAHAGLTPNTSDGNTRNDPVPDAEIKALWTDYLKVLAAWSYANSYHNTLADRCRIEAHRIWELDSVSHRPRDPHGMHYWGNYYRMIRGKRRMICVPFEEAISSTEEAMRAGEKFEGQIKEFHDRDVKENKRHFQLKDAGLEEERLSDLERAAYERLLEAKAHTPEGAAIKMALEASIGVEDGIEAGYRSLCDMTGTDYEAEIRRVNRETERKGREAAAALPGLRFVPPEDKAVLT